MEPLVGWEPVEIGFSDLGLRGSGARVSEMFPERFPAKSVEISRNLRVPSAIRSLHGSDSTDRSLVRLGFADTLLVDPSGAVS